MFWKLYLFPSSGEGSEAPTLLGPLERDHLQVQWLRLVFSNRVGVSLTSYEDGNRSSFQNAVFIYLFRIPDDGQSPET
jgi:hypothetical protein